MEAVDYVFFGVSLAMLSVFLLAVLAILPDTGMAVIAIRTFHLLVCASSIVCSLKGVRKLWK